jgi:hypothetical protein
MKWAQIPWTWKNTNLPPLRERKTKL